jgi:hypothetical protein
MSNHKNRLAQLEKQSAKQSTDRKQVVCVYTDEHTPAEIEALRKDKTIGTLILVEYVDGDPISSIQYQGKADAQYIGVDVGKL